MRAGRRPGPGSTMRAAARRPQRHDRAFRRPLRSDEGRAV